MSISELREIYNLYLTTIDKKQSHPYLTANFFELLRENKDAFFFTVNNQKTDKNEIIAMSLFFDSPDILYGRYWGCIPQLTEQCPFLHFELCYYLGIEYCTENSRPKFEAGAQGEHKLLRGFEAVEIDSYHHIKDPSISQIIVEHTQHQNLAIKNQINHLNSYLPFKVED